MPKIKYIFNNAFLETDCPFGVVDKDGIVIKVASISCNICKSFKSDNYKERYILCKSYYAPEELFPRDKTVNIPRMEREMEALFV